jgi:dTDP-4-dehydrorhamnose 3,5-epimerase
MVPSYNETLVNLDKLTDAGNLANLCSLTGDGRHVFVQRAVFIVAVDIRKSPPYFGKWAGVLLDADKKQQLWIPPGFAHGFVTLSDTAEFLYKTTDFYAPQFERCIAWNEPEIAIDWHSTETPQLSAKDLQGLPLAKADVFE